MCFATNAQNIATDKSSIANFNTTGLMLLSRLKRAA